MTEKRFTMDNPNDWDFSITDNVTGKVYNCASNILMKELCVVVNTIVEENKQLKQSYKEFEDECQSTFNAMSRKQNDLYRKNFKLKEENEQLKQYIYDNLDEDICNVCSYQYLEKSQMDKYYVAKCKKGYDNCSKGTVINCKDFEFKELSE